MCDRCLDMVHPRTDCRDCAIEQQIVDAEVPDFAPRVVRLADIDAEGAALAEIWKQAQHPSDVVASIRSVLERSDPFYANLVTLSAYTGFSLWIAYDCPTREQHSWSRSLFPVLRMLRQFARVDTQITATTPRSIT